MYTCLHIAKKTLDDPFTTIRIPDIRYVGTPRYLPVHSPDAWPERAVRCITYCMGRGAVDNATRWRTVH